MASNGSTNAPYPSLAQEYNNAGWRPELFLGITAPWIIASIGVFFNISLIYVTVKKRMSNWCNKLIAMDAGFCALSELGYTVSWLVYATGWNAIDQTQCFCLLFIPSIGYVLSFGGMLTIAVERLLACTNLQPNSSFGYRKLIYSMILGNGMLAAYYGVTFVQQFLNDLKKPTQVNCNYGDLFLPGFVWTFYYLSVSIVCCAGFCYILIGIILWTRRKELNRNKDEYTRKIFRSLCVITLLVVGTQLGSLIWRITKPLSGQLPSIQTYYQEKGNYCFTFFANTASAPVLYLMSSDYNRAFKSLHFNIFRWLDCLAKPKQNNQNRQSKQKGRTMTVTIAPRKIEGFC